MQKCVSKLPHTASVFKKTDENKKLGEEKNGWHFDKSINLPFLLSLSIFVLGAFAYEMHKQEKQVTTERDLLALTKDVKEFKEDIKLDNRELNRKLDDILRQMRK